MLVTGGAGFIGSHLVDALLKKGHRVRVLDSLEPQVHGAAKPDYLNPGAEYLWGDVTDDAMLDRALADIEVVYHQAALVGVGQSMYQVARYSNANVMGTSHLLDKLLRKDRTVRKLVVASSMSAYGEGRYACARCGPRDPPLRTSDQLSGKAWEHRCETCGGELAPAGTDETKPFQPTSVYAVTKRDQEELCLSIGRAYGLPTVALRYFNVYGPRQSLSNPYTGVCSIFQSRIKAGNAPVIYEDGLQTRDFVSVRDIVQANVLAMERSGADHTPVNVGTGRPVTILEVAQILLKLYGAESLGANVTGEFRPGDIRHCVADISRARKLLGYEPSVRLEDGLRELAAWGANARSDDKFEIAAKELAKHGLVAGGKR